MCVWGCVQSDEDKKLKAWLLTAKIDSFWTSCAAGERQPQLPSFGIPALGSYHATGNRSPVAFSQLPVLMSLWGETQMS